MTLRDQGFLFIYRAGGFKWIPPHDFNGSRDVDCTAMNDEKFEIFVRLTVDDHRNNVR